VNETFYFPSKAPPGGGAVAPFGVFPTLLARSQARQTSANVVMGNLNDHWGRYVGRAVLALTGGLCTRTFLPASITPAR